MKPYPGNKSIISLYPNIINEIPVHDFYWEGFAGSGQILKKKKPAPVANFAIEINKKLINAADSPYPSGTVVINACAISLIRSLSVLGPEHFIYLDPPYLLMDRKCKGKIYDHELTNNDHAKLLTGLLDLKCNVAISHYDSCFYDDILTGWRKKIIKVSYRGYVANEAIYFNYAVPAQLHETTFTGNGKIKRQEIKRKAAGWVRRFQNLPTQERQAVLNALDLAGFKLQDLTVKNNCG